MFVSIASQDYAFDLLELFCSKMANIHNVFFTFFWSWGVIDEKSIFIE